MAVHDRGFKAYSGTLTPEWSRFLVVPRYAYREVFKSRLFTGFLFLSALKTVRADHAAITTYAEPLSAVIFAALLLGEPLTVNTVLGGVAVVAGGIAVARTSVGASVDGPPLVLDGEDMDAATAKDDRVG